MAPSRRHIYVASITLTYNREESVRRIPMNMFIEAEERKVTFNHIDDIRLSAIQLLVQQLGATGEDIQDFHINNISYLGHMTQAEFRPRQTDNPSPYHS